MRLFIIFLTSLAILSGCSAIAPNMTDAPATESSINPKITILLRESKKVNSSAAINDLIKNVSANPNDPEKLYELAYAHNNHAKITQNEEEHLLAINYFEEILSSMPGNQAVIIALYNIYYDDTLHNRSSDSFTKAREYFLQFPEPARAVLNPPSLAKFIATAIWQENHHEKNYQALREILLQAIIEQPKNDNAYIHLAKLYAEDHYYSLAIATLKSGAENINDSMELYKAIAETYNKRANVNNCNYEHPSDIANAEKYYKLAIPLSPDNQELHYGLSSSYMDQHKNNLGLNESTIALAINTNNRSLAITAQDYSSLGYSQKANQLLDQALTKGMTISDTSYHEINMNLGEWQKAANGFAAYAKTHSEFTVYDLIKSDIIAQQSQQPSWINSQQITFNNDWEKQLFNYWNDIISADTLKKTAYNSCEKTEYFFYTGYKDLRNGQTAQAKEKFSAAINQNTYRFIERPLAQYFLHNSIN